MSSWGRGGCHYLCILLSTFVIRLLKSNLSRRTASKISIFYLVSVAEETGLSLALSETLKIGFVMLWPKYRYIMNMSLVFV